MNATPSQFGQMESGDDALHRQIARLVDGELPENQWDHLLEALEATPNGWRACALTFIEAQIFNQAFAATPSAQLAASPKNSDLIVSPSEPVEPASRTTAEAKASWAIQCVGGIACLVLAFALGFQWRSPAGDGIHPEQTKHEEAPAFDSDDQPSRTPTQPPSTQLVSASLAELGPSLGNITLRVNDNHQEVTLPVFANSDAHQKRFTQPTITADIRRLLQEAGHQVKHSMSYEPVLIGEDNVMYVPVEELELLPLPHYQVMP